jgi:hypothetical protein
MEIVPKGTEFTIESTSGERCFVTYKGKPAYIRRGFLLTQQEFLETQAALGQKQTTTNTLSELPTVIQGQSAPSVAPIGYAWPKNDLLITNATPSSFKPLKNGGTYPLLVSSVSGYSIICEGADGQRTVALLPLKDRFGNPLNIQRVGDAVSVSSGYVLVGSLDLNDVVLKPGMVPLHSGARYSVLNKSEGKLSVECTFPQMTQTVDIAETAAVLLSISGYADAKAAVLNKLKKRADEAIHQSSLAAVEIIFRGYQGELAQDTAGAREALAKEYEEKFVAEQKAKGLVEFHGEWVTPTERDTQIAKETEEARQQAEHDQWVEEHKSEIVDDFVATGSKAGVEAYAAYPDDPDKRDAYLWKLTDRNIAVLCSKYKTD